MYQASVRLYHKQLRIVKMEFGIGFSHRQATFLCHSTKVNLFVVEIASSKKVYGWPQPLRLASHSNLISTTADMKRNISRKLPIPNCRHCEFPYLEQRPISHYHSTIRGPVISNFHVISVDTISALSTDTSCTLVMESTRSPGSVVVTQCPRTFAVARVHLLTLGTKYAPGIIHTF